VKTETYIKWFEKRPTVCGFALKFLWQDNQAAGISRHIVFEFSFQFLWWLFEVMHYRPKAAEH